MPDGRHYIFTAGEDRRDLWALPEGGWLSFASPEPVRLTSGPLSYFTPMPSRDGRTIFANGEKASGEVVRCPLAARECGPFLGGIDAEGVTHSSNGEWVAYVLPDGTLWRSRVDGTEKLQLTFPPLHTALPRWSPDGQQIAFFTVPTRTSRALVVPFGGGPTREAAPGDEAPQTDSSWSPDGRRIAVGRPTGNGWPGEPGGMTLEILDLESGQRTEVPGSKGTFSPRWSPDGRYLAAVSHDSLRLLLYEFSSQRWRTLLDEGTGVGYPSWSREGSRLFVTEGNARVSLRVPDGRKELVFSFEGLQRLNRGLGAWTDHGPDDALLTLRDTSIDEVFALKLETP